MPEDTLEMYGFRHIGAGIMELSLDSAVIRAHCTDEQVYLNAYETETGEDGELGSIMLETGEHMETALEEFIADIKNGADL